MPKDTISIIGNRETWLEFTIKLKREKKKVWDVLKPFIENYIEDDAP